MIKLIALQLTWNSVKMMKFAIVSLNFGINRPAVIRKW
jgi:hypothetical protein